MNRTAAGWVVPKAVSGTFEMRNAADIALHKLASRILDDQLTAMARAI